MTTGIQLTWNKKNLRKLTFLVFCSAFFFSCIHINLYEKQVPIPSQEWYYNNVPEFSFHIDDTTSLYNIYIVLRHTDLYQYSNIWLRVGSSSPTDSMHYQKINLTLGNDLKGWLGTGTGDIYEVRKNITAGPLSFKTTGDYKFTIAQIMRDNPLKYIMDVGIRVEKAKM